MYKISDKIVAFIDPAEIEPGAMAQIENVAKLPFIFQHIAVMPDCHLGIGATVGSVIATRGAIVPACVGVETISMIRKRVIWKQIERGEGI